jgi:hypothetical protein
MPWLHLKQSHEAGTRGINAPMNPLPARFFAWYYRTPTPMAGEGQRSF